MINYLLGAISCLCLLYTGVFAEECDKTVRAQRNTFSVPAGGNLSLSCVVQHCGATWKGDWIRNSTDFFTVQENEGTYACRVKWDNGDIGRGHLTLLNVTAAVPSRRNAWHRVLVCASASLCLPIILGLARCLSSKVNPQPLPRTLSSHAAVNRDQPHPVPQIPARCPVPQKRSTSAHKVEKKRAPPKFQQKTEVVYADISQGVLRQQGPTREPAPATVYSSLRFASGGGGKLSAED
ncbi:hypothetical protein D5F01_LYC06471 [Larimichthys crocea]|uniref:Ig-like domain-containing protein n=1 Tax=Larimichthys crocea TaxID=215358 RepID=A0A6G0IVI6_LARCR|nr:hypothetical protein D5F01_LYC06471 [Larimichthys crocea]